jgi:hypothetical protein
MKVSLDPADIFRSTATTPSDGEDVGVNFEPISDELVDGHAFSVVSGTVNFKIELSQVDKRWRTRWFGPNLRRCWGR